MIKQSDVDTQVFGEWQKKIYNYYKDTVPVVECSGCEGSGTSECDCCGVEIECETCNGDGSKNLLYVLTVDLYVECINWELGFLGDVRNGVPITLETPSHPLAFLDNMYSEAMDKQKGDGIEIQLVFPLNRSGDEQHT